MSRKMRARTYWFVSALVFASILPFNGAPVFAQASTVSGSPADCVNLGGFGIAAWANPSAAAVSDNSVALATLDGGVTNPLKCTGYGFALPSNSTIQGITVNVERRRSNGGGIAKDAVVRLYKGAVLGTTDRATATPYTHKDVVEAHGGPSDLWGTSWTAADVNDPTFGALFVAQKDAGSTGISVDSITISVSYVLSAPSATPTRTSTPTSVLTATATSTFTATATPTRTATATSTSVATAAATGVPTSPATLTSLPTASPTSTVTGGSRLVVGPGAYPTIASAVNASKAGDTIAIHAGTYREQVTVDRRLSFVPYGDGQVWIDGECSRANNMVIHASDVLVSGLGLKRSDDIALLIENGSARANINGNIIQDFNCADFQDGYHAAIAVWYGGPGQRITNNTIVRRMEVPGGQRGFGDGIWFKSNSQSPSGGGHYIGGNTIYGGWDGIGGETEGDIHGTFDRNTIVENNFIRNCEDDGIQVEGGDLNVTIRSNTIQECGTGIAFAPNLVGPLFIQNNTITSSTVGTLGILACMKVGVASGGVTYINGNSCNINGPAGNGIQQTNSVLGVMVVSGNKLNVSGYAFAFGETPPAGSSFNNDCMYSTDSSRLVKWNGVNYPTLTQFQTATGQELQGRTGPC